MVLKNKHRNFLLLLNCFEFGDAGDIGYYYSLSLDCFEAVNGAFGNQDCFQVVLCVGSLGEDGNSEGSLFRMLKVRQVVSLFSGQVYFTDFERLHLRLNFQLSLQKAPY